MCVLSYPVGITYSLADLAQAYYISQALDVCDIPHLIYASGIQAARRAKYLVTFNQNEHFRVLLMDVRQAAHGLDISSASRVYFVNPVWRADVEAQAIKRAHRIGQTKPVVVETLVLKGTLEEKMLQRRAAWNQTNPEQAPSDLLDDASMSNMIHNVEILPYRNGFVGGAPPMAPLEKKVPVFGGLGRSMTGDGGLEKRLLGDNV